MTKVEMIKAVAGGEGVTQASVGRIINHALELIARALMEDGRVELGGFGVFTVVTRAACNRTNMHDRTKIVHTPERNTVKFRPSPKLRAAVQ
jgi:DNA-binding protein HU-beta